LEQTFTSYCSLLTYFCLLVVLLITLYKPRNTLCEQPRLSFIPLVFSFATRIKNKQQTLTLFVLGMG